jgi:hypothetical protein
MITSAVLRGLWLIIHDFVFNKQVWSDVKADMEVDQKLSSEWMLLCKEENLENMSFLTGPLQILAE